MKLGTRLKLRWLRFKSAHTATFWSFSGYAGVWEMHAYDHENDCFAFIVFGFYEETPYLYIPPEDIILMTLSNWSLHGPR